MPELKYLRMSVNFLKLIAHTYTLVNIYIAVPLSEKWNNYNYNKIRRNTKILKGESTNQRQTFNTVTRNKEQEYNAHLYLHLYTIALKAKKCKWDRSTQKIRIIIIIMKYVKMNEHFLQIFFTIINFSNLLFFFFFWYTQLELLQLTGQAARRRGPGPCNTFGKWVSLWMRITKYVH